jgi:16S rRNA U516 pseudouridylate synthase RsuA-like enzyme
MGQRREEHLDNSLTLFRRDCAAYYDSGRVNVSRQCVIDSKRRATPHNSAPKVDGDRFSPPLSRV